MYVNLAKIAVLLTHVEGEQSAEARALAIRVAVRNAFASCIPRWTKWTGLAEDVDFFEIEEINMKLKVKWRDEDGEYEHEFDLNDPKGPYDWLDNIDDYS